MAQATVTPITYRCPSCSAPARPQDSRCTSCGYQSEDNTWLTGEHRPPAAQGGSLFEGRYELLEELGRGGMGIVHKAIDRELDEVIALKVLAPAAGASKELVARFKHEVKVARRLTHPNVARLHDLIEIRGQLCLSMEYIEGRSMREVLREGALGAERVIRYVGHLCPALDLAHELGIVHRDLKPGNIIVDPKDVAHILDFGIAKSQWLQERSENGLVGTPAYMAPEQWVEGAVVDGRADLYSLGVMMFEMLCGRRPFEHRNKLLLMEMHRASPPPRPTKLAPDVPPVLEQAILRLLEKDPARRFASGADLMATLEPQPLAVPAPAGEAARSTRPQGRRVLVAEDEPELRRLLGRELRGRGLDVLEAGDGGEALEHVFRDFPDLILLDVNMPVLDGIEVLRLLKNDARTRELPVVMTSGVAEPDHVAFSKDLGAASFLAKPIRKDVLDLLVERYFGAS